MPTTETQNYVKCASWCDGTDDFAFAFMTPEERGVLVARHHSQLLHRGMCMAEVDALLAWAAPQLEHHEVLLKLALFDRTYGPRLNMHTAEWEPPPPAQTLTIKPTPIMILNSLQTIFKRKLIKLNAASPSFGGPKVPALSGGDVQALAQKPLRWVWPRDAAQALLRYPPPLLYKLRPCPSYSGCRDCINLVPNLMRYKCSAAM